MSDFPYLSLSRIAVDPTLARTLPRRLAFYYQALPLARDDDELTLVMAHPENQAAVAVLQAVLGEHIVPVQGAGDEIKATLGSIWAGETGPGASRVLAWGASPENAAQAAAVADMVAPAFRAQVTCLDASQSSLDTVLTVAREGQYSLTVIDAPQGEPLSRVLRQSSTPVLLVRGARLNLCNILLVLRGHSPDDSVLDWIIPLAQMGCAAVTLLTVTPTGARGLSTGTRMPNGLVGLLSAEQETNRHVMACAQRLTAAGIRGQLTLRQGEPEHEIALEVAQGGYDLVTIAAEAHGDFVQRVLCRIDGLAADGQLPVLVIKPLVD
jgi:nucleotide-binding universal stress UspA family protein